MAEAAEAYTVYVGTEPKNLMKKFNQQQLKDRTESALTISLFDVKERIL
jgi:hypothetical protein